MGTEVKVKGRKHLHAQIDEDAYNELWAMSEFRGHFTHLVNLAIKKFLADIKAAKGGGKKSGKKETASDDKSPSSRSK